MSAPTSIPSVVDFLKQHLPFDQLSQQQLEFFAQSIEVIFCSAKSETRVIDYEKPHLYVVRTGEYEIRDSDGRLLDRLAEGDQFGYPSLLSGQAVTNKLTILSDGLIYKISQDAFLKLKNESRAFDIFYINAYSERKLKSSDQFTRGINKTVAQIISRRPVQIDINATIQQAARLMTERGVSSIMVTQGTSPESELKGIVTDRDLRSRVVAEGMSIELPVNQVMSINPYSINEDETSEQVLAFMLEKHIHHLPVLNKQNQLIGMVTTSDLVQMQITHPVYLVSRIKKANRLEQLVKYSNDLSNLLLHLIRNEAQIDQIGAVIAQISDAITIRLIELAVRDLGEPPMKFCWLAFGSQGRKEQNANSDQDNGLMLEKEPDECEKKYFSALAEQVNSGLHACGFVFCPGDVMAKTSKWMVSLKHWQDYFTQWVNNPEPMALMHSSIFFDLRLVYGDNTLFSRLQSSMLEKAAGNQIFLALLSQNTLKTHVPIGFFKQFVLEKNGEQLPSLDLKHKGLAPIVDMARIYALSEQLPLVSTTERLLALSDNLLTKADAQNLLDAYHFIARLRLEHQLQCRQQGKVPDNHILPDNLSSLQQLQLKDAFMAVDSAQQALKLKFSRGFVS